MSKLKYVLSICIIYLLIACKSDVLPKPSSQLRLDYDVPKYQMFDQKTPYNLEINKQAELASKGNGNYEIHYPKMKATLYISYKQVAGNIGGLLRDAQNLTYKHVVKADDITEQPFINKRDKVYGMFYDVNGNAATNAQFYVTDSSKHFVTCSVYFYAKPNFDSILPAVDYLKKDMRHAIESFKWK